MLQLAKKINKNSPVPVYKQIKGSIRQYVIEEKLKIGDSLPTENELCEIFDVSRMTARKAVTALVEENIVHRVHGKGTFVAERVEPGYTSTHKVIGIITPRFFEKAKLNHHQSPVHYEIIGGLEQYFQQKQFDLSLLNASYTQLSEKDLSNMPVAGIIIITPYDEHIHLVNKIKKSGKPFVAANCFLDIEGVSRVNIDVFKAGYDAAKLQAENGRKNIVFLGAAHFDGGGLVHYQGYEKGMKDCGLVPQLYRHSHLKNGDIYFDINDFMATCKNCDGIVVGGDVMAIKFINTANEIGIKVPDDISVCGFYDSEICRHISPALTSIRLPLERLGIETGKRFFSLIENPDSEPEAINIPPELIVRKST